MSGRIMVEFLGMVKGPGGARKLEVGADGIITVAALLVGALGFTREHAEILVVLRDGARLRMKDELSPGERLEISLHIGGG